MLPDNNSSQQNFTALVPVRTRGGSGRLNNDAKIFRDNLAKYFLDQGRVPWQEAMVGLQRDNFIIFARTVCE